MHSGVLLSATARPQINETITYTRICREKGEKEKKEAVFRKRALGAKKKRKFLRR